MKWIWWYWFEKMEWINIKWIRFSFFFLPSFVQRDMWNQLILFNQYLQSHGYRCCCYRSVSLIFIIIIIVIITTIRNDSENQEYTVNCIIFIILGFLLSISFLFFDVVGWGYHLITSHLFFRCLIRFKLAASVQF